MMPIASSPLPMSTISTAAAKDMDMDAYEYRNTPQTQSGGRAEAGSQEHVSPATCPRIMIPKAAHATLPQVLDTNLDHSSSFDFSGDGCADEGGVDVISSSQARHRKSVSPIPENFFDDAAWEEVESIAPPPRPHHTPLPSRPTAATALLVVRPPASFSTSAMAPAPAVCFATQHPSPLPQAARTVACAAVGKLQIVTDFTFQEQVMARINDAVVEGAQEPGSMLVIQPTASGKGAYASALAKSPSNP